MRPLTTLLAAVAVALATLAWTVLTWYRGGVDAKALERPASTNANLAEATGITARLAGENHLRTAVAYSQAVYAATSELDRPGAVVLVRDDDLPTALTATRLQHMPVNAPLLYVRSDGLPDATREELKRLDPEGVGEDRNVQVYLVGDISEAIAAEVRRLGFRTKLISAPSAQATAEALDEYLAIMESDHRDVVLVGVTSAPEYAFGAANWNAHNGDAFAWITSDGVPAETRRMLERRGPNYPYIYVFAPPEEAHGAVLEELTRYGHVQRIPGSTPQEMAVRWAGYKDSGRMLGWWFGQQERSVGWGISEAGHNVIVANPSDWRDVVATGVLSHMGKHAPLVLTDEDGGLSEAASGYLRLTRPTRTHPSEQVRNFAWAAGAGIPQETLRTLYQLLTPFEPSDGRLATR